MESSIIKNLVCKSGRKSISLFCYTPVTPTPKPQGRKQHLICAFWHLCVGFSTNFRPSSIQVSKLKLAVPEGELLQQPGSCQDLFNSYQHGINHTAAKSSDSHAKYTVKQ